MAAVGEKLLYTYDFGDNWEHVILVEKSLPAQPELTYPRCTAGRRAAPPDDCGGIWAYHDLLDAVADPTHQEHESAAEWLGSVPGEAPHGAATFDPAHFKAADVTAALAHLAR